MPRFFCPSPLQTGEVLDLPPGPARHVQVLRMQPGHTITLFNHGPGWDWGQPEAPPSGEFEAEILLMGRSQVQVRIGVHSARECEAARKVSIAIVMPANERMDWLVEKATELGVSRITPVMSQRSVIRLNGVRSEKRVAHWNGITQSACAQSGRNWLPQIDLPISFSDFFSQFASRENSVNVLLSTALSARNWRDLWSSPPSYLTFVNGPEGGFSLEEEQFAFDRGFVPISLGSRVLRSETASIAVLAQLL